MGSLGLDRPRRGELGGGDLGSISAGRSWWSDIRLVEGGPVEVDLDIKTKAKEGLLPRLGKFAPYNPFLDRQEANP